MEWQTRIEDKIDRISNKIETINITLVKQESNLQEHMRRTDIAEANLALLKEELSPIKTHISKVEGGLKLIGIIGILVSMILGIIEIIKYIK